MYSLNLRLISYFYKLHFIIILSRGAFLQVLQKSVVHVECPSYSIHMSHCSSHHVFNCVSSIKRKESRVLF
jgi:hypothetical protein